jgi:hypothetical protein
VVAGVGRFEGVYYNKNSCCLYVYAYQWACFYKSPPSKNSNIDTRKHAYINIDTNLYKMLDKFFLV